MIPNGRSERFSPQVYSSAEFKGNGAQNWLTRQITVGHSFISVTLGWSPRVSI